MLRATLQKARATAGLSSEVISWDSVVPIHILYFKRSIKGVATLTNFVYEERD